MAFKLSVVASMTGAALVVAAHAAAQTPIYRVTDLNAATGTSCVATAINDSGQTAGSCAAAPTLRAANWKDNRVKDLGVLPNGHYAAATAINSFGVTVGDGDAGDWQPRPFVTFRGTLLNIDPSGGANMRAVGIMDNGIVFGNYAKGLSGNTSSWTPVYYVQEPSKPDRYRRYELPRVAGGDAKSNGAYLTASNKLGQAAGWVQTSLIGQRAAFWSNDAQHSVVVLETLAGSTQAVAWSINDRGQAVGGSWIPIVGDRAVLWDNDAAHTPIDLGVLPGDVSSTALGANAAGQVIGVSVSPTKESRAFVTQQGVMLDLASLIAPEDGVWAVTYAFAINNSGQILAIGINNGRAASILLTPAVP